jgi:type II secretory ATPase GspE/PulE/Tfp pilus assembly ATPase PilB-like protein
MEKRFYYSPELSKKVTDYLFENGFLNREDLADIEERARLKKTVLLKIFLDDNPGLQEKVAKLIAHLNDMPFFAHQENIPVCEFGKETESCGAYIICDAEGDKLLCLDPVHESLHGFIKGNELTKIPLVVMSQITYEYIRKHYDELIKTSKSKSNITKKSKVEIIDADDTKAADANAYVYNMFKGCIMRGASDIHIDLGLDNQGQFGFKLRYRVDGTCIDEDFSQDIMLYRGIVNKLKLDAGLKIDERRLPQDGRISFEFEGKVYNFRLSFMPNTIRNAQEEKIVLRQMADVEKCDLYKLDILDYDLKLLEEAINYPHGFICVTGPTGSGKTTLLYAMLQQINRTENNVITLEDPIEAEIPLLNQSQTFHRIGYDFSMGLRVILRQDPDIIMVGEMRDEETASKAFEAANTGHLVFSTLHTNTASSSVTRLLQMKVPYYFISSALKFVLAQRLVRRVCPECGRKHPHEKEVMQEIENSFKNSSKPVKELFDAVKKKPVIYASYSNGSVCTKCQGAGYKGRMAIMEVMKINDDIRHVINFENGNEDKIQEAAIKNGMLTIQQYGYIQVLKGLTTFEEINNAVLSA